MTSTLTPEAEAILRQVFKRFNVFMLLLWRLGLGSFVNVWPEVGGRVMVLTHTGRKSGLARRTPVNYALVDGTIYCVAGFGSVADWYRNILVHPVVEVWLPDSWWSGTARDVSGHPNRTALMREVLIASGFAARLFGLNPHTLSDSELAQATANYCLVEITRTEPRTGPGGPGDLQWIWPLATMILLPLVLSRRKNNLGGSTR